MTAREELQALLGSVAGPGPSEVPVEVLAGRLPVAERARFEGLVVEVGGRVPLSVRVWLRMFGGGA